MNRNALMVVAALGAILSTNRARAWDEDTCGPTAYECDPNCASYKAVEGRNQDGTGAYRVFDHAVAHFEMTYALARCVGVSDANARIAAAADEATDMSSGYCGSVNADNGNVSMGGKSGTFYYEGYACGLELGPGEDAATSGAVPAYDTGATGQAPMRWRYTDRCHLGTNNKAGSEYGHSEFFHYPMWAASPGATYPNLIETRDWAEGKADSLMDPKQSCDFTTNGSCAGIYDDLAKNCSYGSTGSPPNCNGGSGVGTLLCANTWKRISNTNVDYSQWTFPAKNYKGSGGLDWSTATAADFQRLGIFLHSNGDYWSHSTCELYAGQPVSSTNWIVIPTTSMGPTNHGNYEDTQPHSDGSANFDKTCSAGTRPSGVSKEMCDAACSFAQHDCEFGDSKDGACSAAGADSSKVDLKLRNGSLVGLNGVWNALVKTTKNDPLNSSAMAIRDTILNTFVKSKFLATENTTLSCNAGTVNQGQYLTGGLARQKYAASLVADGAMCSCTDASGNPLGVYGWKPDSKGNSCCLNKLVTDGAKTCCPKTYKDNGDHCP